ncbi:MAG: SRPBCC domain-containing protein [Phycisphaerales bacterium]|nr:SRPBCC domain-containing protein [Phycisphaerales bacterium]
MPSPVQVEKQGETIAKFRVLIKGPIDAVWREITRTDAPIPAFFNSRMHVNTLAPGSRLAMRSPDGKVTGVVGEILEFDPPRRFSHTFKFTNFNDPACKVTYELEPRGDSTQFTLTITDLPVGTKTAKQMLQGGVMIASTLKNVIETGRPSFGTRVLFTIFKLMAPFTPKKCLSEHWPV